MPSFWTSGRLEKKIREEARNVNICRCHWLFFPFILTWQSTLPCKSAKGILSWIQYITREDIPPSPDIPAQMIYLPHPQAMSSLMVMEVINMYTNTICAEARLMSKIRRGWWGTEGVRGEAMWLDLTPSSSEVDLHTKRWISAMAVRLTRGSCFRFPMLIPHSRWIDSKSLVRGLDSVIFFLTFQIFL